MTRVFLISDTHFNHDNIIKYTNRPFTDAAEMNAILVEKWNRVVKPGDVVYHLGDFSLNSNSNPNMPSKSQLVAALNGKIILVRGNHDNQPLTTYFEAGFTGVTDKVELRFNGKISRLQHHPLLKGDVWPDKVDYIFHGHVHQTASEKVPNIQLPKRQLNVSVERIHYTPILLEEALKQLNAKNKTRRKNAQGHTKRDKLPSGPKTFIGA